MIKNDIKLRQICFIFLAFMPVNKILMLPSILSGYAFQQLYIPLLINFIIDIVNLLIFIALSNRFPGKTLYYIMTEKFGENFSRVVYFLYAMFFLLKSLVPIIEQKYYVDNTLYEVFPNILSFLPLLLISGYACCKGLKVLGRTADISIWFTAIGFLITFVFSVGSVDITNILPINKAPTISTFFGAFATTMWFSDSAYMFLFLGHFENTKHKTAKLVGSYSASALIVTMFMIFFFSIFGNTAPLNNFAVSEMTIYTTKLVNISRFDYLAVFFLLFSGVYSICLPVFCTTKCLERTFGFKKAIIPSIIVNAFLLVVLIVLQDKFHSVLSFAIKYLNWYFVMVGVLFPIIFFIILQRRKNVQASN